jgi:N-acetylglucosamine-6-sulfatase
MGERSRPPFARAQNGRVNVLWIITDDQMRSTLGKMRQVWSRVVRSGTRFYRGYAAVPLCGPARVSTLTSMYVHNHGIETNWTLKPFRDKHLDHDTVATRLQAAGWTTGYFGKYLNGYPRDPEHVAPGWDRWVGLVDAGNRICNVDGDVRLTDRPPDEFAAVLLQSFVRNRSSPWFAVFAPTSPHSPYEPSPEHEHDFDGVPWHPRALNEADMSDKPSFLRDLPLVDPDRMRAAYEGKLEELQDTDDQIGAVLDTLAGEGVLGETWVFFVSDNGFLLGEHRLTRKEQAYEESSGVPFVVTGPGVPVESRARLASQVDLMPTTLEIAGLDPDAGRALDGRSMLGPLTTGDWTRWRRRLLVEHPKLGWAMLREGRRVLVDHYDAGEQELYDLLADPDQLTSRHATTDTTAMTARLTALRQAAGLELRALEA